MIELITGLPGNAKTLLAIRHIVDWAQRESRPVFYAHVKGLLRDDPRLKGTSWTEIDPTKWMECPTGAIIFVDECQKVFRNRSLSAQPPLYVTELEEHRHRGVDFVLLTQHPSLIDPAVRRLTQTHRHLVRIWGMEASTVHRWDAVRENCEKPSGRKDSEKTKWVFDKSLYGLYHSADKHTFKRQIPLRAKLLLLVPVVLAAAGWFVYHTMVEKPRAAASAKVGSGNSVVPAPGVVLSGALPAARPGTPSDNKLPLAVTDPVADARAYVAMQTPRIAGLPQTAPKYDGLTQPTRVPVPAACIQIGTATADHDVRCKCFTQQGTPMEVEFNMCIQFARNGYFQDFDPDPDKRGVQLASASPIRDVRLSPADVVHVATIPELPQDLPRPSRSSTVGDVGGSPPPPRARSAVPMTPPTPAPVPMS